MRTKEQVLNWVDYMLKSNPCMNVEDRNMFNAIKYYITEKQTDGDLIIEWKNDFKEYINSLSIPRDDYNGIMEYIDEFPNVEQTGGDLISRQDVINVIEREQFKGDAISEIEKLPPVTSQPKTGRWISLDDYRGKYNENGFMCSECGEHVDFEENFCPNCGAKMEEGDTE